MIELSRDWVDIPITKCGKLREYWPHQASFLGKTKTFLTEHSEGKKRQRAIKQGACILHFSMKFIGCLLCTYHKMLYNSVGSDECSLDRCQVQIHMVSLVAFVS